MPAAEHNMIRTFRERLEAGLCRECGRKRSKAEAGTRCRSCAVVHSAKQANRNRNRYREYDEKGLCVHCGKARTNATKLCDKCRK